MRLDGLLTTGVALALLCGCGTTGAASPSAHAAATTTTTKWPTYHLTAGRTGNDRKEPSFAAMSHAWTTAALDGAVYAEPLVFGSNIIVATEHNSLYSFDAASGQQLWHANLGSPRTTNFPCGNIMPLGITSTPVITGGSLYAVAEVEAPSGTYRFHLAKVNPTTGAVVYNKDGKPLYSWRVLLLPYLDQDNLFKEFKKDEPWDSPHNRQLIPLMPDVFRDSHAAVDSTTTRLMIFCGPNVHGRDRRHGHRRDRHRHRD